MTVDSETTVSAQPAPVPPAAGREPDPAGRLLARLTALPALLVLSFLLVSFPLLLVGWFQPVPTAVLTVAAAAVIVPLGWRAAAGCRPDGSAGRTPWWTVAALAAVAIGFGVDQALFHSQFVIITRDPGSYMEFAAWISRHGSLPIVPASAPFGGQGSGGSALHFASWAFYPVGTTVVPQFMAGLPMALSVGFWTGGMSGAFLTAPVLGAAGVFTFGGLVSRLTGPRWALVATMALALSLPEEFVSRSTYSEPLSQVLFLGGMCLLIDALRSGHQGVPGSGHQGVPGSGRRQKALAALAGLCLGLNFLARLDGPSDMLLLVPFCGLLLLRRKPQTAPLAIGIVVGLAYGAVDAWFLTRPYLRTNATSVKGMTAAFAAAVVVTAVAVVIRRRRGVPRIHPRLADAAAVLPFVMIALFAVRPYVQTDYQRLSDAPLSLHWVYWYAGGPVIVAATVAAALLIRRCLRGQSPDWLAPLLVFMWTTAVFLYQPGITPDQPWGSRRLAPAVLPGLFLLATWLAAEVTRRVRARGAGRAGAWGAAVLAACCALAITIPPAITTFNLRYAGGLRLTAGGWAADRMYAGEESAVRQMCAALPPDASVLFVDTWDSDGLSQAVRGICGVPTASLMPVSPSSDNPSPADVRAVIDRIERAGRRPVLLAQSRAQLNPYPNGTVRKIMDLTTVEDQHAMDRPPTGSAPMHWNVWMWEAK